MRILNLYADADGESHFREIEIECTDKTLSGFKLSKRLPSAAIMFAEAAGDLAMHSPAHWHRAPFRQYVINLAAGLEVTTTDGESRVIRVGEVVLVEDTTGKGHITRLLDGNCYRGIFVRIDRVVVGEEP
jgi:oxalate decarboxylase/phosphoglucose isomerase-like protein (cupin superfamily)